MRCGQCYAVLDDDDAVRVVCADLPRHFAVVWVCADERACWARQDYQDWLQGAKARRHYTWLTVTATTQEGEPVL